MKMRDAEIERKIAGSGAGKTNPRGGGGGNSRSHADRRAAELDDRIERKMNRHRQQGKGGDGGGGGGGGSGTGGRNRGDNDNNIARSRSAPQTRGYNGRDDDDDDKKAAADNTRRSKSAMKERTGNSDDNIKPKNPFKLITHKLEERDKKRAEEMWEERQAIKKEIAELKKELRRVKRRGVNGDPDDEETAEAIKEIEHKIVEKHLEEKNLGGEDREKQEEELESMEEELEKLQEKVAKSRRPNSKAHIKNVEKMEKLQGKVKELDQKLYGPEMEIFRIEVPEDAVPGEMFTALAGETFVRMKCPEHVNPGDILQLSVPKKDPNADGAPPDSDNVRKVPGSEDAEGRLEYLVKVPDEVEPGAKFPVTISGMQSSRNMSRGGRAGRCCEDSSPRSSVK